MGPEQKRESEALLSRLMGGDELHLEPWVLEER
jgi:hypothetical protein